MADHAEEAVPVTSSQNDEIIGKWGRSRRHPRRKVTIQHLLKSICASRETCLDWLKNRGLIPKVLFCPNCNNRMTFESNDQAVDGYIWICKECVTDPPQFSSRHGSWLESRDAALADILLFTYLWSHGFSDEQICKETNLSSSTIDEWNLMHSTICDSLYQRNMQGGDGLVDGNILDMNKESSTTIWRRRNKFKDPFLEFLKDAGSL